MNDMRVREAVEVLKAERGNIELIEPEDYLREQALSLAISKLSLLEQVEEKEIEIDEAELLDIIAQFQEGFNTNLHCLELVRCLRNNKEKYIKIISR